MMKIKGTCLIAVMFTVFIISTLSANAALSNRGTDINGNRLIYDSDLNITWYDYTNNPDSWSEQMNWAAALTVNFGGNIYNDWRLVGNNRWSDPWKVGYDGSTTAGYNITSSKMGHLFYAELGNLGDYDTSGNPQSGGGLNNTGYFQNLTAGDYWMGPEVPGSLRGWYFRTAAGSFPGAGYQGGIDWNQDSLLGLAVRSGDVPQQPVAPEPISSILFITGGGLLAGRRFLSRKA